MNPLETQIKELEKRIEELERAQNLNAVDSFMNVLVKDVPEVVDAEVSLTVTDFVGPDGGTISLEVLDFPDKWLTVRHGGELHRIPSYLKRLDSSR